MPLLGMEAWMEGGRCPQCANWLGLSRIEEILFLFCQVCGYLELDRGDDSFSGYIDSFRIRKLRLALTAETDVAKDGQEVAFQAS